MKRWNIALAVGTFVILSGCGGIEKMTETTVAVDEQGNVEQLLVEDFSDAAYQLEELETMVNELITSYNQEAGEDAVVLKSAKLKEETARLLMEYQSTKDYRGFNQVDFFCGSVKEAQNQGYTFHSAFADTNGTEVSNEGIPAQCEDAQVLILREPMQVVVPGKILYVSKNMEVVGETQAKLPADESQDMDNQVTTQAYGYVIYQAED